MAKFTHTDIEIRQINRGVWQIRTMVFGKPASEITTDSELIDAFHSKNRGWKTAKQQLRNKVILKYKMDNGWKF